MKESRSEAIHIGGKKAKGPKAWVLELDRTGSATDLHKLFTISEPQFPYL